jgi:aryl-alcohol dehydrogenase-like predicted oxidoreductase
VCGLRVDDIYLQKPDTEVSLAGTPAAAHRLKQRGLVGAVGMRNYHAAEVARACALCFIGLATF